MERLQLIVPNYLDYYKKKQPLTLLKHYNKVKNIGANTENFNFYFSNAAVYSSMIEGNKIDFDSYLKYSYSGMNNKGKSFKEIEDLKQAYNFAKKHKLTQKNFLQSHQLSTQNILTEKKYQGALRDKEVYVFKAGIKIYTGISTSILKVEMNTFFNDIALLIKRDLSIAETFYYASMIHLVFVQIHPFADGNGRAARLLEKWFLVEKIGANAWFIQSERLYQKRIKSYYNNVNLGNNYTTIDYDLSIKFLLMLPMSLRLK